MAITGHLATSRPGIPQQPDTAQPSNEGLRLECDERSTERAWAEGQAKRPWEWVLGARSPIPPPAGRARAGKTLGSGSCGTHEADGYTHCDDVPADGSQGFVLTRSIYYDNFQTHGSKVF